MINSEKPYRVTSEKGFSLVELLVVLALIGIIGGLVSSAYLFSQRMINDWRLDMGLQNKFHTVIHGLSEDMFKAERITVLEKKAISLKMPEGEERKYYEIEDRLYRNERLLVDSTYSLSFFELSTKNSDNSLNSSSHSSISLLTGATILSLKIGLTDGKDTLRSERKIYLRKGTTWKSLRNQ